MTLKTLAGLVAIAALGTTPAAAQQPLKIGFITTLSGPAGYIGADIRDAFQLAIDIEGGKLGGIPVRLIVEDDGFKPGQGKQVADRFLKTENIKLFTGIVFSNIAGATVPDILDAGAIYVSPNAAPSNFAGKECHKNYYVVSWQNDSLHESAGQNATNLGYKRVFILAPNYQAGKDALAGFKRLLQGRDRRRGLYAARPNRLCAGNGADPRRQAGRRLPVPSRRPRHRLHPAISASGPARDHPDGGRLAVDRRRHPEGGRRCRARHQWHVAMEYRLRQSREQEVHGGVAEEVRHRTAADLLRQPRL